ncbi:MAG TPA: hypothetical protein VMU85_15655, partial [Stellaceae bacterium]|nr:hypothetical protein [Stellaceae bacterium]
LQPRQNTKAPHPNLTQPPTLSATTSPRASETPKKYQTSQFFSTLLEHDPEKWMPVFGKDHAQTKN